MRSVSDNAALNATVATTTWSQIPVQTKMSVGARHPIADGDRLVFTVLGNAGRWVEVTLEPSDTYTVRFFRINRSDHKRVVIGEEFDVYNDMLGEIIYSLTHELGAYTP